MSEHVGHTAGADQAEGEVHVWLGRVPGRPPAAADLRSLSSGEILRAARQRFERDRTRQLWRRILVRRLLSRYTGLAPASIPMRRRCGSCGHSDHGKPYLDCDRSPIGFSVSGSADLVAVAVGWSAVLGVDIETRQLDWREVDFVLTPAERDLLSRLPERDQPSAFVQMWTRKEACLKAEGTGLARGRLESLETTGVVESGWATVAQPDGTCTKWWVADVPLNTAGAGAGAVATRQPSTLRIFRIEDAHLVRTGAIVVIEGKKKESGDDR